MFASFSSPREIGFRQLIQRRLPPSKNLRHRHEASTVVVSQLSQYPTDHFKLQRTLRSYAKDLPQLLSRNQRFSLCLNSPLNPPPLGRSPASHSPIINTPDISDT